jgi:tetratricopeptide (TPR) repeat protein
MRFRMLETLREYAAEQLTEEERATMAERHAYFFLTVAEEAQPNLETARQVAWLDRLEMEHENLRAALRWSVANGASEDGLRLAAALWRFWSVRGYWAEGREWLATHLSPAAGTSRTAARARALQGAGTLARDQGEAVRARLHYEESLAIWRELGSSDGVAELLNLLGLLDMEVNDLDGAQLRFTEALNLLPEDEHALRARVLHNLALLAAARGDAAEERRRNEEALSHRRAAGDARGVAETLGNLGGAAYDAGDFDAARRLYSESLALRRELRDRHGIALMLNNLGELAEREGNLEVAVVLLTHAERIFRELKSSYLPIPIAALERLAGQLDKTRWAELRVAGEQKSWEAAISRTEEKETER